MSIFRSRQARYVAPVVVMAVIGLAAWAPTIAASPSPPLPSVTAQQLLVDVQKATPPELSGTMTWTANLGISDLSSLEQVGGQGNGGPSGFNPINLLAGSYEIDVWLDGTTAGHLALVLPPAEEVDLVRNGDEAWLWDSSTDSVVHLLGSPRPQGGGQGQSGGQSQAAPVLTPQQLASRLLGHLDPTTSVSTGPALYVAGETAYQLLLSPKATAGSTIAYVEIDLGATGALLGVPLRVAVYSVGQASPALELGFTGQLNLGAPPASELTFTPPPGAKVVTRTLGAEAAAKGAGAGSSSPGPVTAKPGGTKTAPSELTRTGSGWTTVVSGSSGQLGASAQGPRRGHDGGLGRRANGPPVQHRPAERAVHARRSLLCRLRNPERARGCGGPWGLGSLSADARSAHCPGS